MEQTEQRQGGRILIVDDIQENLQVLETILSRQGFECLRRESGAAGLQAAQQESVDLILLDVMMPEMDGFETCQRLQAMPATREIPVILLTALSDSESVLRGFEVGAVDYVAKPFRPPELMARIRTHLRLRRTERELRSLNASKDRFISIVADELAGPAAGLRGMLSLLEAEFPNLPPEDVRDSLMLARESADRVYGLLQNLTTWAGLQQGNLPCLPRELDLSALLEDVLAGLGSQIAGKRLEVHQGVAEGHFVYADPLMLSKVLHEVLANAVKFNRSGGRIETQVQAGPNGGLRLEVIDSGVGIAPEDQQQLFRIDQAVKRGGAAGEVGTGMGLILSRELMQRNGGKLDLDSRPGAGVRVVITLPIRKGA